MLTKDRGPSRESLLRPERVDIRGLLKVVRILSVAVTEEGKVGVMPENGFEAQPQFSCNVMQDTESGSSSVVARQSHWLASRVKKRSSEIQDRISFGHYKDIQPTWIYLHAFDFHRDPLLDCPCLVMGDFDDAGLGGVFVFTAFLAAHR
jgi:hypothetical protein